MHKSLVDIPVEEFIELVSNSSNINELGIKLGFSDRPGKSSREKIKKRMDLLELDFSNIETKEENPKPHKEPILKALDAFKYDDKKHQAFMVGDTKLDLISASNASINSVGVLCGYSNEEELLKYTNIVKKDSLEAVKHISLL